MGSGMSPVAAMAFASCGSSAGSRCRPIPACARPRTSSSAGACWVSRITVDELRRLMLGDKRPVVVDVRSEAERKVDGRFIPGALAIDLDHLEERRGELPDEREIVFYCTCPNEASAAVAAKRLMAL